MSAVAFTGVGMERRLENETQPSKVSIPLEGC